MPRLPSLDRDRTLLIVTVVQAACGLYLLTDALDELDGLGGLVEIGFVVALWIGSLLGVRELFRLARHNRHMEGRMRAASGALGEMIEESFDRWELTPSERDVALLALKGLTIGEIAAIRETRDGTVKAQCAAIYRKAGVSGRPQLMSFFVEELMAGVTLGEPAERPGSRPAAGLRAAVAGGLPKE
ncbi:MAG: helix-turn-helix transcriptional regulator [Amaricoccus sp.]